MKSYFLCVNRNIDIIFIMFITDLFSTEDIKN